MSKTILPNLELKNGKRRCSHQFVVKALVTTSPNGFVTVTDITLLIAVQNFFFSQGGISNSEIVISLTTSTDFAIRFSQFSTINSDAEKWEKNQISLKVLHYAFQLAFYLCLE